MIFTAYSVLALFIKSHKPHNSLEVGIVIDLICKQDAGRSWNLYRVTQLMSGVAGIPPPAV